MTDIQPAPIRARSHEGLLAAVPYLLGFHPARSLVLIFSDDQHVVLSARVDLPESDDLSDLGGYLAELALVAGARALATVTYDDDVTQGLAVLERVRRSSPLPVTEAIHADGTHFWAPCCDIPVVARPYEVGTHQVAAEAVLAGASALPDRAAMQRLAAGPAPGERADCLAAFTGASRTVRDLEVEQCMKLAEQIVRRHLAEPGDLDVAACALLATLVEEIPSRDAVWLMMTRADADRHLALWSRVVQHTIAPWEMAPLCLLGSAAWIAGNGALLVECIERGERIDSQYSMLRILSDINVLALPPSRWEDMTLAMDLRESCRSQERPSNRPTPDEAA